MAKIKSSFHPRCIGETYRNTSRVDRDINSWDAFSQCNLGILQARVPATVNLQCGRVMEADL